jgi:hypothetical protein
MSRDEGLDAQVSRNIKLGAQPASLFELPKGYKVVNLGAGLNDINKMMEQMQNQKGANDASKKTQDANKTEQQKMQEALKMLEGQNKK